MVALPGINIQQTKSCNVKLMSSFDVRDVRRGCGWNLQIW